MLNYLTHCSSNSNHIPIMGDLGERTLVTWEQYENILVYYNCDCTLKSCNLSFRAAKGNIRTEIHYV